MTTYETEIPEYSRAITWNLSNLSPTNKCLNPLPNGSMNLPSCFYNAFVENKALVFRKWCFHKDNQWLPCSEIQSINKCTTDWGFRDLRPTELCVAIQPGLFQSKSQVCIKQGKFW